MLPPNGPGLDQRQRMGEGAFAATDWRAAVKTIPTTSTQMASRRITPLKRGEATTVLGQATGTNGPNLAHNPFGIENAMEGVGRGSAGWDALRYGRLGNLHYTGWAAVRR